MKRTRWCNSASARNITHALIDLLSLARKEAEASRICEARTTKRRRKRVKKEEAKHWRTFFSWQRGDSVSVAFPLLRRNITHISNNLHPGNRLRVTWVWEASRIEKKKKIRQQIGALFRLMFLGGEGLFSDYFFLSFFLSLSCSFFLSFSLSFFCSFFLSFFLPSFLSFFLSFPLPLLKIAKWVWCSFRWTAIHKHVDKNTLCAPEGGSQVTQLHLFWTQLHSLCMARLYVCLFWSVIFLVFKNLSLLPSDSFIVTHKIESARHRPSLPDSYMTWWYPTDSCPSFFLETFCWYSIFTFRHLCLKNLLYILLKYCLTVSYLLLLDMSQILSIFNYCWPKHGSWFLCIFHLIIDVPKFLCFSCYMFSAVSTLVCVKMLFLPNFNSYYLNFKRFSYCHTTTSIVTVAHWKTSDYCRISHSCLPDGRQRHICPEFAICALICPCETRRPPSTWIGQACQPGKPSNRFCQQIHSACHFHGGNSPGRADHGPPGYQIAQNCCKATINLL